MTPEQFQQYLAQDPYLSQTITRAARAGQRGRTFGVVTEAALIALMFPLVRYLLQDIGLPWLLELRRYSELQRQRLHAWIDSRHQEHGLDPDAAEAASDALLNELEQTTDERARASWQQLAELINHKEDEK
jgi:hypothetical protein